MTYGLSPTGFVPKPLQIIKAELEADLRSQFGAGINLEPGSVFGQFVGIFAERESLLWEVAEDIYDASDPDKALASALDALAALTGAMRLPATKSTAVVTATGTVGTEIPAGRVVSVSGSGARFQTLADATIGAGGTVAIEVEAEDYGPVPAYAGTLTVIETPVSGWDSVTNTDDAEVGRNVETDAAFRVRREALLSLGGSARLDAIRARILNVDGVTACSVFENTLLVTVDGMPPHSVEVLVQGGDDADIAEAVRTSVAGGIATHGSTTVEVTDESGIEREVKFSRPTEKPVYVIVYGFKDAALYPADGDDRIKLAVKTAGDTLGLGVDVVSSRLLASVFSVAGVVDVTAVVIGLADPPTDTATIAIGPRERATFNPIDIAVNMA